MVDVLRWLRSRVFALVRTFCVGACGPVAKWECIDNQSDIATLDVDLSDNAEEQPALLNDVVERDVGVPEKTTSGASGF